MEDVESNHEPVVEDEEEYEQLVPEEDNLNGDNGELNINGNHDTHSIGGITSLSF